MICNRFFKPSQPKTLIMYETTNPQVFATITHLASSNPNLITNQIDQPTPIYDWFLIITEDDDTVTRSYQNDWRKYQVTSCLQWQLAQCLTQQYGHANLPLIRQKLNRAFAPIFQTYLNHQRLIIDTSARQWRNPPSHLDWVRAQFTRHAWQIQMPIPWYKDDYLAYRHDADYKNDKTHYYQDDLFLDPHYFQITGGLPQHKALTAFTCAWSHLHYQFDTNFDPQNFDPEQLTIPPLTKWQTIFNWWYQIINR